MKAPIQKFLRYCPLALWFAVFFFSSLVLFAILPDVSRRRDREDHFKQQVSFIWEYVPSEWKAGRQSTYYSIQQQITTHYDQFVSIADKVGIIISCVLVGVLFEIARLKTKSK